MKQVKSSNIEAIGIYKRNSLVVKFHHGNAYLYETGSNTKNVYTDFCDAESKGRYFQQNVKNAGYKYEIMDDEMISQVSGTFNNEPITEFFKEGAEIRSFC